MSKFDKIFGDELCKWRKERNFSQEALASMVGIARASICNYEAGENGITLEKALLISKILGFSLDKLPIEFKKVEFE